MPRKLLKCTKCPLAHSLSYVGGWDTFVIQNDQIASVYIVIILLMV